MNGNESLPQGAAQIDEAAARHQGRRLARQHPQPSWLHQEVAQRMLERLPVIKLQPQRVLQSQALLGGGDEGLRQLYPKARQAWWESDEALRALAQQRLKRSLWQSLTGGANATSPEQPEPGWAQLLWANMGLHGVADKPALLARWHAALAVDGFLMFSCLGPDSFMELRPLYAREGWGEPAPAWVDMHDLGDMLVHAGFADPVMDQEHLRLTWGSPEDLLRDLRALGGNLAARRFAGLRTPRWRDRLLAGLESLRGTDGRLGLSVELVYGHAFKPQPRVKLAAQTEVSLDQMRAMVRGAGGGKT